MSRWERFCLVGIGGHARSKLIPAIEANGQTIAGFVSRQPREALRGARIFATLDEALATLAKDTVIVIATPPSLHHRQVRAAIDAGFDAIVEKPAFVTAAEARDIAARCAASDVVLVEAFMQRHTELYRHLIAFCAANPIVAIDVAFVIPAMPPATFRSESDLASSSLYDIGCYVLALLSDLELDLGGLEIVAVRAAGTMAEAMDFAGTLNGITVKARIGVAPEYRNKATVWLADGSETSFHPLFYGRAGSRALGDETIEEGNAFEAMFAVPRERWLSGQSARLASVVSVTAQLEALAAQLARLRDMAH